MSTIDQPLAFRPRPVVRGQRPLAIEESTQAAPPTTLAEARDRFINRYLFLLIGALLGGAIKEPTSVAEWLTLATAVKRVLDTRAEVRQAVKR